MPDNTHLEYPERFHNFIVFEPASLRVHDSDILMIGEDVNVFFNELTGKVLARKQTIKEQILHNKLVKIGHMLELLNQYDQVLITQYFDKIWRRYSYISHLGESFLSLGTVYDFFPEYKKKKGLIANRYNKVEESSTEDSKASEESNDIDTTEDVVDAENSDTIKNTVESET